MSTRQATYVQPVLPPVHAQSANDLFGIELPAEVQAENRRTHYFVETGRCMDCDCRPWGEWARFACRGWNADANDAAPFEEFVNNQ